jgi:hypothetical protein
MIGSEKKFKVSSVPVYTKKQRNVPGLAKAVRRRVLAAVAMLVRG